MVLSNLSSKLENLLPNWTIYLSPCRDPPYDSYPGPGGEPPSHLVAGPQTYTGSPYGRPSYEDVNNMDMYRSTPPADDAYRRLPNGSYSNLSPADRYRNTPPIDGGADPYRDLPPIDDDRFDPNRPPSERGDGYLPRSDGDDQYGDARPDADRYGRPLLDDGRQRQTPSPAPGSDRPGRCTLDMVWMNMMMNMMERENIWPRYILAHIYKDIYREWGPNLEKKYQKNGNPLFSPRFYLTHEQKLLHDTKYLMSCILRLFALELPPLVHP